MPRDGTAEMKARLERGVDHLVEIVNGEIEHVPPDSKGRVADQNINRAGLLDRVGNQCLTAARRKNIGFQRPAAASELADFCGCLLQVLVAGVVVQDQVRAGHRQLHRTTFSDAAQIRLPVLVCR